MSDCIFCKIIKGELHSHKVYENERVYAFLDNNPVNPGHTLVIPKEHHDSLLETPDEIAKEMMAAVKKLAPAILKAVGAEGYNLAVNVKKVAGQVVFHTHFHVIPRFSEDGLGLWPGKPHQEGQAEEIVKKIKKELI